MPLAANTIAEHVDESDMLALSIRRPNSELMPLGSPARRSSFPPLTPASASRNGAANSSLSGHLQLGTRHSRIVQLWRFDNNYVIIERRLNRCRQPTWHFIWRTTGRCRSWIGCATYICPTAKRLQLRGQDPAAWDVLPGTASAARRLPARRNLRVAGQRADGAIPDFVFLSRTQRGHPGTCTDQGKNSAR